MEGLTNCMYTAQGELVCVPNKKTEESYLIETFATAKKPAQKVVPKTTPKKSSSLKCSSSKPCPTGETCSQYGYCRADIKPKP